MLALCCVSLASDNPACDLSAKVFRDPHLNFAHGGSADFRGQHNALYSFLSLPNFTVNVKTEEAVFKVYEGTLTVKRASFKPKSDGFLGPAVGFSVS